MSVILVNAHAQKLPGIQKAGLWAPSSIKIDGKATEWGNKFQAYNAANHLFYSIANDDKSLYLIVKSSDKVVIEKIVRWGLTLTISSSKKSKDTGNISIGFPVENSARNLTIAKGMNYYYSELKNNGTKKTVDSFMLSLNTKLPNTYKEIKINGIKEFNEATISIYNEQGIRAACLFDNAMAYNYELAIPLKYLPGPVINGERKFNYNIKLPGGVDKGGAHIISDFTGAEPPEHLYWYSATDFWGECTLASK